MRDDKVKIFSRQDTGIWGNGKVSEFTTGPEIRVQATQVTNMDPTVVLVNGRIVESEKSWMHWCCSQVTKSRG